MDEVSRRQIDFIAEKISNLQQNSSHERHREELRYNHLIEILLKGPGWNNQRGFWILGVVVAFILGAGSIGLYEVNTDADRIEASVEEVREAQKTGVNLTQENLLAPNRSFSFHVAKAKEGEHEHEGLHHLHVPEDQVCVCNNPQTQEVKPCWMGSPCDPTGLILCQQGLPGWKCKAQ